MGFIYLPFLGSWKNLYSMDLQDGKVIYIFIPSSCQRNIVHLMYSVMLCQLSFVTDFPNKFVNKKTSE